MSSIDSELITNLRELFKKMGESRAKLRPILVDMTSSIEEGIFIDSYLEEVTALLETILDAQENFLKNEHTKRAASSRRLEQVDGALVTLEQNYRREEFSRLLTKISALVLDSQDEKMIQSVKLVKREAEYLKSKIAKVDPDYHAKSMEKFVLLDEIASSESPITTEKYMEIAQHFPDNQLLLMIIAQGKLHYAVEEKKEKREELPVAKPPTPAVQSLVPTAHAIGAVVAKFKKIKPTPDLSLLTATEENFQVTTTQVKKPLTVKSFQKKLRELVGPADTSALFKFLVEFRIVFSDDAVSINQTVKLSKKFSAIIPTILGRMSAWGIVDRVEWRGRSMFFLNNFGCDICSRAFRNVRNSTQSGEDDNAALIRSLRYVLMHRLESDFRDAFKINFHYLKEFPFARAAVKIGSKNQVVIMLSLILLGEGWEERIAKFRLLIENEINEGCDVHSVFVIALNESDLSWLGIFDTSKFRNKGINFFLYTNIGIIAPNGVGLTFDEWKATFKFGKSSRRAKKGIGANKSFPVKVEGTLFDDENLFADNDKVDEDEEEKITYDFEQGEDFFDDEEDDEDEEFLEDAQDDEEVDDELSDEPELSEKTETPADEEVDDEEIFQPAEVPTVEEPSKKIFSEETTSVSTAVLQLPEHVTEKSFSPKFVFEPAVENDIVNNELIKVDSLKDATNLFDNGSIGRGMLALHALKDFIEQTEPEIENWAAYLAEEIGFILEDPLTEQETRILNPFIFWTNSFEIPKANVGNTVDYLNLAATIKAFFAPVSPTSFQVQKSWKLINDDKSNSALKACPAAKNLISLFKDFTTNTHNAFANCLDGASNNSEDAFELASKKLKTAEIYADELVRSEVGHPHMKDLVQQVFKGAGIISKYFKVDDFAVEEILQFCRQFADENSSAEENGATNGEIIFSDKKLEEFIDKVWDSPKTKIPRGKYEGLMIGKRRRFKNVCLKSLEALADYARAKKNLYNAPYELKTVAPVRAALEILDDVKNQLESQLTNSNKKFNLGQIIFKKFIENLEQTMKDAPVELSYKECVLTSNYIELENGLPSVNSFGVEEFSLYTRQAAFESEMNSKVFSLALRNAYETALKNYDYGILQHIIKFFMPQLGIAEKDLINKLSGLEKNFKKRIDTIYSDFLTGLELARNYSRITDQEKIEFYINAAVEAQIHFMQTKNAGLFKKFLDACNESIIKSSMPQKIALTERLKHLEETLERNLGEGETLEERYPVIENIRRQIELMNLTVAEDYMNRLETEGSRTIVEIADMTEYNLSTLENFLNSYETLLTAIKNANDSVEGAFKNRLHGRRPNRKDQDALDFLQGWQGIHSGQSAAIENAIISILSHLGYAGGKISSKNVDELNKKSYTVTFEKPIKMRESYPHPFAVFGTEIYSNGLEIIYLGSNRDHDNIAHVLAEMTTDRGTICFVDVSLKSSDRRSLARIMKMTPNLKNILVIDKVMALYLASFDDANRGKRMLQTVLPFSRVQPYVKSGAVAPEMFIGRSEELDKIRDMNGPVLVYGGRQLGKSALLKQVRSIEHNPAEQCYAFLIDLKNLNTEQALQRIVGELSLAKLIGEVKDWDEFSLKMHKLLNGQINGVERPKKLLLLMDESDVFLSQPDSEKAINVLRELLGRFSGQFKFVLAGLHRVIRFEQNSSFGNLSHISVFPFKPSDAMELLMKPMSWLGFRISDDSLTSAIFSRTNYYPGLIQYYCGMLVDALGDNYSNHHFDVIKNPPYTLDDEYVKNMLGSSEFQQEINRLFQITLELDDDNYYEILALAVAMEYYANGRPISVSLDVIKANCEMCSVDKIERLTDRELSTLLDEMVTLNLLRRVDDNYEFNRYAFWHMMGTVEEVERKLDSYGNFKA
ncbi:MAG: hypothetical protein IJT06_05545 [Selenomonadaceae bacterium]|nr:hypothetical protein [Selenomonadaceae bacterium]